MRASECYGIGSARQGNDSTVGEIVKLFFSIFLFLRFVHRLSFHAFAMFAPALRRQLLRPCSSYLPRYFSTDPSSSSSGSASTPLLRTSNVPTMKSQLKELRQLGEVAVSMDRSLLPVEDAKFFPRIKTTSLSTRRVCIADSSRKASSTLVMLAFRRYAEDQLTGWADAYRHLLTTLPESGDSKNGQLFDCTINESFASQFLSGFVQRFQRSSVPYDQHDFHVAFNAELRPLEGIFPISPPNRLLGYVLLLDPSARVRFRAAGHADDPSLHLFTLAARQLIEEDNISKQQ